MRRRHCCGLFCFGLAEASDRCRSLQQENDALNKFPKALHKATHTLQNTS